MSKIQSLRGFKDVLFDQAERFSEIIDIARNSAHAYNFQDSYFPILEPYEVFQKTLGDSSDIINKEMYVFNDRSDNQVALRPEFTAQIVRSYISNGLKQSLPLKLFSYGPVFRYERPQKGRLRQFHQVNYEIFGLANPLADAEIIAMASNFLKELGVLENTVLKINSLGCAKSRNIYRDALVGYFSKYKDDLSEDSKRRLEQNPLRILDSKDESDRRVIVGAPKLQDYLTAESREFFSKVLGYLDDLNITYERDDKLVRGLDYYNHSVFEFVTDKLGAQGTVLAGGRYDSLIEQMGGGSTPAIGFAAGIERLAELLDVDVQARDKIALIPYSSEEYSFCLKLAEKLRKQEKVNVEIILSPNAIGKRVDRANKLGKTHVAIIGEDEVASRKYRLKNLSTGEELEF